MKKSLIAIALLVSFNTFADDYRSEDRTDCISQLDEKISLAETYRPTLKEAYQLAEILTVGIPVVKNTINFASAPFYLNKLKKMNKESIEFYKKEIDSLQISSEVDKTSIDKILMRSCNL